MSPETPESVVLPTPPLLGELPSISPSRFAALKRCALREVWAAGRVAPFLPVHPSARVGTVTHRLLEDAARGRISGTGEHEIAAHWIELIKVAEEAMTLNWLERHLVPLSASVPDFAVRQIRAVTRALEAVRTRTTSPNSGGAPPSRYGYELFVETADRLAAGWIDAVVPSEAGPILRDYKTGAIHETTEGLRRIKVEYVTQLRLYAAIYASATGTWPARLELVPMSGPAESVPFDRGDCASDLEEAVALLAATNKVIRESPPVEALDRLATPSPQTCAMCAYRPACPSYLSASDESTDDGWPSDVRGSVTHRQVLGNGSIALTVQLADSTDVSVRGLSGTDRHPALQHLSTSDEVAVFGLRGARVSRTFNEGAFTTIYFAMPAAPDQPPQRDSA